ncbi:MAG: TonB family protein [Acidobacteria bacterium]|nr:TonB family protein [Acidobacteriota bacterium]
MVEALQELEIQVELCPEIFAAVERLTSHGFDIVVADWNEGPEASFLLKTSRELKANESAFRVALVPDAVLAANSGADLVLETPFETAQVKRAFLTCDAFLARMQHWLAAQLAEDDARSGRPQTLLLDGPPPSKSVNPGPWEDALPPLVRASSPSRPPVRKGAASQPRPWLRGAALGVALFSLGYVFVAPLRSEAVAASVVTIYDLAVHKAQAILRPPEDEDAPLEVAQSHREILADRRMAAKVRVVPVRDPLAEVPRTAPPPTLAESTPAPKLLPAMESFSAPAIPESLRSPLEASHSASAPAKVASASLLAALEPVPVPEDVAEKLLLERIKPSYPEQALKSGLQGPVILQAWIGRDGKVEDLKLVHGYLVLGQAAAQAVRQWRYQPYLLNGRAVAAQTYVTVDFRLP